MNSEYLILNVIIISGPLALSFDKRVFFIQYWREVLIGITIPAVVFIVWDALVTGRHWYFNDLYTLESRFLNIPPGEWLFFITVPYACLFVWQVLHVYFKNNKFALKIAVTQVLILFFVVSSIINLLQGKEYTAIVSLAFALPLVLDRWLGTHIFYGRLTIYFTAILIVLMLVFNGYLTARPIVLYGIQYQLDFRIITIPVEDFFYGLSLVYLNVILFEYTKRKRVWANA
ncbi:MAG: lycopene cyclase domain-containing protein [Caldithrix sp.]|nr:lycopene cyclase domain-containing protein [Caldithrix sp.]